MNNNVTFSDWTTSAKLTFRPDFFGTVPNFDGLSRKNYEVFRDAEFSRIPNPVPILSRSECNVTSPVDKFIPVGLKTEKRGTLYFGP